MKKIFILLSGSLLILKSSIAQDSINVTNNDNVTNQTTSITLDKETSKHPYKTSFKTDAPIIAIGLGLTYLGNTLIKNEKALTVAELANKTKDKVPFFDRGNAGFYSDKINKDSYIPFLGSFAMPLIMVLNKNESRNASYILVMYLESASITSALFTMAAGTIHRSRPLVYGTIAPTDQRINKNNQRSFFAGHTASTASATFFAAKVFQDINPDSKAKPFVWALAAAIPAVVGYLRYQSGFHFLSDNLLGYVVGAASGILIPQWHKSKGYKNLSFVPYVGKDFKGLSMVYKIK
ncbi:MAG TPA: phosphatase PAP2 family protein [Chitinophagaceae bacterium]